MNMEHASPRTRRRARTHSRILEVCRRRIGTHGLDGLRLTEIADAVDLTAAALYRYFRSKGALIAALNAQIVLEQQSALHRIERGATRDGLPDPLLATMAFIEHLTRTIEREPGDFGLGLLYRSLGIGEYQCQGVAVCTVGHLDGSLHPIGCRGIVTGQGQKDADFARRGGVLGLGSTDDVLGLKLMGGRRPGVKELLSQADCSLEVA